MIDSSPSKTVVRRVLSSMGVVLFSIVVPGLVLLVGCPSGNGKTSGGKFAAGACDSVRERVESLYKAEQSSASEAKKASDKLSKEARFELIAANTHMVLKDCETDPKMFLPCIERASSAAQLESECVIALDDAGKVEDQQFRKE